MVRRASWKAAWHVYVGTGWQSVGLLAWHTLAGKWKVSPGRFTRVKNKPYATLNDTLWAQKNGDGLPTLDLTVYCPGCKNVTQGWWQEVLYHHRKWPISSQGALWRSPEKIGPNKFETAAFYILRLLWGDVNLLSMNLPSAFYRFLADDFDLETGGKELALKFNFVYRLWVEFKSRWDFYLKCNQTFKST